MPFEVNYTDILLRKCVQPLTHSPLSACRYAQLKPAALFIGELGAPTGRARSPTPFTVSENDVKFVEVRGDTSGGGGKSQKK